MYAIYTKYLKATGTKGARIKATIHYPFRASVTIPYDYSIDHEMRFKSNIEMHFAACRALILEKNLSVCFTEKLCYGMTKDGWVFTNNIFVVEYR